MTLTLLEQPRNFDMELVDSSISHVCGLVEQLDWHFGTGYRAPLEQTRVTHVNPASADAYFSQLGKTNQPVPLKDRLPSSLGFVKLPSVHTQDYMREQR